MTDVDRLLALDRAHLWHPYSSATTPSDPHLVESAAGVRLRLRLPDGSAREVIDAMSPWWCAIHGYAVPELDSAAHAQLRRMSHVMFGGLTHEPAIALAERLVDLTPAPLQHVFLADSGSVSVEVAMKMALQTAVATGSRRTRFFTIRGGYHGDTFSPMSVTDPDGGMHSLFTGILPVHAFAPCPPAGVDVPPDDPRMMLWEKETRRLYAEHADEVCAVILEPLLQGAGGMRFHSPHVVRVLASLAREHGALVIFDEIATGFGRTGTLFAMDGAGVVPDIVCLGKALTGGYLSLAAVLCTRDVATAVSRQEAGGALTTGLEPARDGTSVADVRVLGGVGVIQLREPVRAAEVAAAALERGVWVRPFRDLVYTMPAYVMPPDDLAAVCTGLVDAVRTVHG